MLTDSEAPVTDLAPARPAGSKGFNMRLAMIVPGLGVLILGIFITVGFLTAEYRRDLVGGRPGRQRPQGHHRLG